MSAHTVDNPTYTLHALNANGRPLQQMYEKGCLADWQKTLRCRWKSWKLALLLEAASAARMVQNRMNFCRGAPVLASYKLRTFCNVAAQQYSSKTMSN